MYFEREFAFTLQVVYKKYIKIGEKRYGPYLYENKRVDGEIVTFYKGKHAGNKFNWIWMAIFGLIIILIIFFLLYNSGSPTGRVTSEISPEYRLNEPLTGSLKFNLKEGEFIPQTAKVIITHGNQIKELTSYCERQDWKYEIHKEYASGSKSIPDKLRTILRLIKEKHYDIFLVYDLSRFSRLHPTKTNKIMDFIVSNKCRFLSLQDNIDSDDEIKWLIIKPMFQYMAWVYILETSAGKYYVGSTKNLEDRLRHHVGGHTPSTKRLGEVKLAFSQKYDFLNEARSIELKLKKLKRSDYIEKILRDGFIKMQP